ncbi:hypothetical protein [Microbacterium sp.]|uniref:hypothetical protein n=1 Tax=Microbacterium sp. TaxID=51671 RepID=UPI0039E28F3C
MYLPLPSVPVPASQGGMSYGAMLLPAAGASAQALLPLLLQLHFSGWVAPPGDGWAVVIGEPGDGVVADGRRGVIEAAAFVAERMPGVVLAVRVRRDRQLALVAWRSGEELGRYSSDPSQEPDADKDVLSEPVGTEHAETFAALCGHEEAAGRLTELLGEELDPDSVFESERLAGVARLLGLPGWLVAAGALPDDIPTGPRARELTRLRAGAPGAAGRVRDAPLRALRRHQQPPPVIADPPRGGGMEFELWML